MPLLFTGRCSCLFFRTSVSRERGDSWRKQRNDHISLSRTHWVLSNTENFCYLERRNKCYLSLVEVSIADGQRMVTVAWHIQVPTYQERKFINSTCSWLVLNNAVWAHCWKSLHSERDKQKGKEEFQYRKLNTLLKVLIKCPHIVKQSRGWLSLQVLALFPGQQVSIVDPLITVSLPQPASVCRITYIAPFQNSV